MIIACLLASVQSIRPKGDTLLFSTDARCNAGVPQLLRDRVTYVMSLEARASSRSINQSIILFSWQNKEVKKEA